MHIPNFLFLFLLLDAQTNPPCFLTHPIHFIPQLLTIYLYFYFFPNNLKTLTTQVTQPHLFTTSISQTILLCKTKSKLAKSVSSLSLSLK